jgi:hypothetical protein
VQRWLAALAVIFLAAHLAFLSPTLEDIDSINFALGVRHFDVAQHQPHPPGSPVFVALGKISTPVFKALGVPGAESRALAIWSVLAGAAIVPLVFVLFAALDGDRRRAFWSAALSACAPLAWFTAARPMTDMTGLALALASQALAIRVWAGHGSATALFAAGAIAGLAAGVRIQTAALTVPVFLLAALSRTTLLRFAPVRALGPCQTGRGSRLSIANVSTAVAAALAGVLLWAVPLVVVSGGPTQYLVALGSQAGEDFEWVRMLWKSPTDPRVAFHAFVNSFAWPWGWLPLGLVVTALSFVGLFWAAWRTPRATLAFAIAFGPYAVFHLLFQETTTLRYALPLVVPMAYLVVRAAALVRLSPWIEIAVIATSLVVVVPQTTAFGKGSPGFAAMRDAVAQGGTMTGHAGMRRLWEWMDDGTNRVRYEKTPHGFEWLTLVDHWQKNPEAPAQFLANPRRTEHLVLFDPQARQQVVEYRWGFPEWPLLGGARPGAVTRILFSPPGWMLDRGWAISAEIAGITEKEGYGPHRRPSIAWVRGRSDATTLIIGGRHLGAVGDPDAQIDIELNGVTLTTLPVKSGFFVRTIEFPPDTFRGTGYLPLRFTAKSLGTQPVRVALEQFDLQPTGTPMLGLLEGWQEPEYDRTMGRAWRWISDRGVVWVRPVDRDVVLTLRGLSPSGDFDGPTTLRTTVNGREIASLSPTSDFTWEIPIRAADLPPDGRVTIEADRFFVPGDRQGTADRRRLAVRIASYSVR